uniref:Polyketide-type polyunsaturated fatty acid synthase PfaA n=1 Tax=Candidatus Kentrum sp. FW TaxID=2126338 RepID=A0A450SEQ5_9GAMM|nr:MAG: polyketide-type polyunsaturated fatty acid synthase PfaA [Candidatus Kentron sp. FW]
MEHTNPQKQDIAIVGLSAIFPGSPNLHGYWNTLVKGLDCVQEVPPSHWLIDDYFDPDPTAPDKTYSKYGAFLSPMAFDVAEFGMPPNVISATDPVQLLALLVARDVLIDTFGKHFKEVNKERMGVILGSAGTTGLTVAMGSRLQHPIWTKAMREAGLPEDKVIEIRERIAAEYVPWREDTFPGLLGNVTSGRIANRLDLGGSNYVTDAACASSLSALSAALDELYLHRADMMITGGSDTLNDILMYMCFSKTLALSTAGDCCPFSDRADGTLIGEGAGMLALQRLEDAERDGNTIYAVIKGLGSSSDGHGTSVYAPLSKGQARSLQRAYGEAGYGPEKVTLVDTHGTGTKAGDVAEFAGLKMVFGDGDDPSSPRCALGSVKSQIAHTKAAAGTASLIKIVLALHHRVLPPTIKANPPNPKLDFANSPFYLNTRARPWIHSTDEPRRASTSSFGFGGTNFHVTLEEYRGSKAPRPKRLLVLPSHLFLFSAQEKSSLQSALTETVKEATRHPQAFGPTAFKTQMDFDPTATNRLALVATDIDDLNAKTDQITNHLNSQPDKRLSLASGIHYDPEPAAAGKLAFLFSGQGSHYPEMGADLAMAFPTARRVWDDGVALTPPGELGLHEVVFPAPVFDAGIQKTQRERLNLTSWTQPAIAGVSLSQLLLLNELGLQPDMVGGHSLGEITALFCAGVLDLTKPLDALRVARRRGELMALAGQNTPGAMCAVFASAETVKEKLSAWGSQAVIANHNTPKQVALSADVASIEALIARFGEEKVRAVRLPVSTGFHSPIVSPSCGPFREFLNELPIRKPHIPLYSNTTAGLYPDDPETIRDTVANQLAEPVLFLNEVRNMHEAGARIFVEVGPGSTLTGMVGQILADHPHEAIALDTKDKQDLTGFWNGLARISLLTGKKLNFASLWENYRLDGPPEVKKGPTVLTILGTNYGKPYPPSGGSKSLPPPNPSVPNLPTEPSEPGASKKAVIKETMDKPASREAQPSPVQSPTQIKHAVSPSQSRKQAPVTPHGTRPAANSTVSGTHLSGISASQQSALTTIQSQLIESQRQFQDTLARSHEHFLGTMEQTFRLMADRGLSPTDPLPMGEAWTPPVSDPAPFRSPGEETYPAPEQAQQIAPVAEEQSMAPEPSPESSVPENYGEKTTPMADESATAPAAAPTVDPDALLLEVVSEKTGYPVEMLEPDMELEAGLGIDSIKRVEILAAVQEKIPGLPELNPQDMGTVKTLQEISNYLKDNLKSSSPTPTGSIDPASADDVPVASSAVATTATDIDPQAILFDVVVEKTGYPAEMLEPDMELEAGLGIDSIKRVEILAAVQEKIPGLPELDPQEMAGIKTLGEISGYLNDNLKSSPSAPTSQNDAANTAAPVSTAPDIDPQAILFDVVVEKTGYPAEMLEPDMELEAGLGIDSIKRVEILAAVQEKIPGLPELDPQEMAGIKTLGEIAQFVAGCLSGKGAPAAAQAPESESGTPGTDAGIDTSLARFEVGMVEAPAADTASDNFHGPGTVSLIPDDKGVAEHLKPMLEQEGFSVNIEQSPREDADMVLFLPGLNDRTGSEQTLTLHEQAFMAARQVASRFTHDGGMFITVQDTGGRFGLDGNAFDSERAWIGGLPGLVKTATLEWPKAELKSIDLEPGDRGPQDLAKAIFDELRSGGPALEVGLLANGQRVIPTMQAISQPEPDTLPINTEDVIVVSGGGRGIVPATLIPLARTARCRFVLLGRTPLAEEPSGLSEATNDAELKSLLLETMKTEGVNVTPGELNAKASAILAGREIRQTLRHLEESGAEARYYAVDVRDNQALNETLESVRRDWGPIRGVIHGAGVLADKFIADKTPEQFEQVFNTKISGIRTLLAATANDPLRLLVFFSSITARQGNPGQSDYAMANELLNKIAQAEVRTRGSACRVISFNWGPWEGGMVTPSLKAHFGKLGVPLIPLEAGGEFMVREIASASQAVELVVAGPGSANPGSEGGFLHRAVSP